MLLHTKHLQGPEGWIPNQTVRLEAGRVTAIAPGVSGDLCCEYLTLGLLDQHHHGALGFDAVNPSPDKAAGWLVYLARRGVLNILYTIGSTTIEDTRRALAFAKQLMDWQQEGGMPGARVLGAHLEGPFINPARSGAMNKDCILPPSLETYRAMTDGFEAIVRLVTLAPEEPGAMELTQHILAHGGHVQAGHTEATCAQAQLGFSHGVDGVCHTFNAMRPIHQREGGILTAALLDPRVTCEAICDLVHVDPQLLRLLIAVKTPQRVALVSDSTPSAGLPDGQYFFVNHPIIVRDGRNYTPSGGIAGSAKQASDGVKNLVQLGIPSADVIEMATVTPRRRLRLFPTAIEVGASADLTLWDADFSPLCSFIGADHFEADTMR